VKRFINKFFEGFCEMLGIAAVLYVLILYYEPETKVFCNDIRIFEPNMITTKVFIKHCENKEGV